jgi:hypothetical protein
MNELIEYMKIHLISLRQDIESEEDNLNVRYLEGCAHTVEHLLSVGEDILNK